MNAAKSHRYDRTSTCNVSKALNRPLNPLWRMNTNSTELPVIVLHLWDRGSRDVEETLFKASVYSYMMYVFGVCMCMCMCLPQADDIKQTIVSVFLKVFKSRLSNRSWVTSPVQTYQGVCVSSISYVIAL